MTKICTSPEQSKKLLELGIDVNTADIYYTTFYGKADKDLPMPKEVYDILKCPINEDKCVPAWSLTALLELIMPKGTTPVYVDNIYQMVYDIKPYYITSKFDNPLDAAFEMIVWLKENGKL